MKKFTVEPPKRRLNFRTPFPRWKAAAPREVQTAKFLNSAEKKDSAIGPCGH